VVDATTTTARPMTDRPMADADLLTWLEQEFPGWHVEVSETRGWQGTRRALWTARRNGHHPQSELSPAKLHSRLSDYLLREDRRSRLRG